MVNVWKISDSPMHPGDRTPKRIKAYIDFIEKNNFVAIGWQLGNLKGKSITEISDELRNTDGTPSKAKEIYSFVNSIHKGDMILSYGDKKIHNIGRVGEKEYYYTESLEPELLTIKVHANQRIQLTWLLDKREISADFSIWRDTVHKVEAEDLIKIFDFDIRVFLQKELDSSKPDNNELSLEECKNAFIKIRNKLSSEELEIIKFNYLKGTVTATELSKKMNYDNYGTSNLNYGKLARKFYEAIEVNGRVLMDISNVTGEPMPLSILVNFKQNLDGEWTWTLKKPIISALKELGWFNTQSQMNLNRILYGPPGTGKTYKSVKYAVEVLENE